MDCVGCDKCRLWGKVQTSGVGTALKILFELDESALEYVSNAVLFLHLTYDTLNLSPMINHNLLTRSEVVALINTLHRWTESLVAVNNFRKMWAREAHSQKGKLLANMGRSTSELVRIIISSSVLSRTYIRNASSLNSLLAPKVKG